MNMITPHDRQLAETLRSLSTPSADTIDGARAQSGAESSRKIALAAGCAVLLVGAAAAVAAVQADWPSALLRHHGPAPSSPAPTIPASPVAAPPAPLAEITGSGYVVAPQAAAIYAKYSGRIAQVAVEPGDTVAAGAPLIRLSEPASDLALSRAKVAKRTADLALEAAQIALADARATLKRKAALRDRDVVSSQQLQEADTKAQQAANAAEQAQAAADKAALNVENAALTVAGLTIRAPFAGTVTRLTAHVGEDVPDYADAIRETPLMRLVAFDTLAIDADVAEKALGGLKPGLEGEAVLDAFPAKPFRVDILRVAPEVDAAKGTVTLRLTPISPPEGIRPGMAARVRFSLAPRAVSNNQTEIAHHGTQQ